MATWRIVYNGRACRLAVARGSTAEDIDFTIRDTIALDRDNEGLQYELANGALLVLSSALPDGIEVHCKPQQDWAAVSAPAPASRTPRRRARRAPPPVEEINLFIKSITETPFTIVARTDDTIEDVKGKILERRGASAVHELKRQI